MKASEIVEKFKNVLLNADEEQVQPEMEMKEESDIEVKEEEVVLSEQKEEKSETTELSEEVEAGYDNKEMEEMPSEKPEYVTKEELAKAIAEVKAMVANLSQDESEEVPQELNSEEKQELSAQEPAVEPIAHDPESAVDKKPEFLYSQKKRMNTRDIVFNKISNF